MGFLDKVKGWLNIGGVKVKLQGVNPRVPRTGGEITGSVLLTSKGDKDVVKMIYRLVVRQTTKKGDTRHVEDHTLSEIVVDEPFTMKAGATKTLEFSLPYSFEQSLMGQGGILGAIGALGKVNAAMSGAKETYFVVAICDVKGTAFDPRNKVQVTIVN